MAAITGIASATPHVYGKSERPGRKIGHVTLTDTPRQTESFEQRLNRLLDVAGVPDVNYSLTAMP